MTFAGSGEVTCRQDFLRGERGKKPNSRTDKGSQVAQFSHFSVKELLISNRLVHFISHQERCQVGRQRNFVYNPPTAVRDKLGGQQQGSPQFNCSSTRAKRGCSSLLRPTFKMERQIRGIWLARKMRCWKRSRHMAISYRRVPKK